jgi:hypothetical protein
MLMVRDRNDGSIEGGHVIHIYCTRPSQGALELVRVLGANRLRRFDGADFWRKNKRVQLRPGDSVICWGNTLPDVDGLKVYNGDDPGNKYSSLRKLTENGLRTVVVATHRFSDLCLPRKFQHIGGNDLLNPTPPAQADFWSEKEEFVREYRIHSFAGKSIRAGVKMVREGFPNPHPWIRSYDAGWRINYDGFKSTRKMRNLAHEAVKNLGLTFGAVDIGELADGTFVLLEVNRAPGIEGNSIERYAEAIRELAEGRLQADVEEVEVKVEPGPYLGDVAPPLPPNAIEVEAAKREARKMKRMAAVKHNYKPFVIRQPAAGEGQAAVKPANPRIQWNADDFIFKYNVDNVYNPPKKVGNE